MKRAWVALLVTLVLVIPARLYVTFSLVDPQTGFYTDGGKAGGIVSGIAVIGIIAVIALSYRKSAGKPAAPFRSAAAGVFAALAGVFVAGQSLVNMAQKTADENTVMNYIFSIVGLFAAVSFLVAAYDLASGETVLRRKPLLALLSSIWGCLGLISMFVNYAATVNRLENVYHTFTVAFLLLFLFSQAKLLSGIDEEKGGKLIYAYGFSAVIVALADAVPNLARYFSGESLLGSFPVGLHMANIILAVYILVYLAALQRVKTETVMVSVPPSVGGHEESSQKNEEFSAGQEASGEQKPTEEVVSKPQNSDLSSDSLKMCSDFLKKAYQSEGKFVENVENSAVMTKSIKS